VVRIERDFVVSEVWRTCQCNLNVTEQIKWLNQRGYTRLSVREVLNSLVYTRIRDKRLKLFR